MHVIITSLSLHLTVREDRSVVPLQNGLYQRRPTDFIYPLLGRPVPENGVEEEALRGFPRISPRVTHDDFSPVFLCLSDAASPIQQSVKMRGESRRLVTVSLQLRRGRHFERGDATSYRTYRRRVNVRRYFQRRLPATAERVVHLHRYLVWWPLTNTTYRDNCGVQRHPSFCYLRLRRYCIHYCKVGMYICSRRCPPCSEKGAAHIKNAALHPSHP